MFFVIIAVLLGCESIDTKLTEKDSIFLISYDTRTNLQEDALRKHPLRLDSSLEIGESRIVNDFAIYDTNKRHPIYYILPEVGYVEITKVESGKYIINEFFDIPIGQDMISSQINRLVFEPYKNIIYADTLFKPDMWYLKKAWKDYIEEYNDLKTYSGCDWDSIPSEVWEQMRYLMFKLSLAAVNGCEECDSIIMNIRDDFDFVCAGEYGFYIGGCELMIKNRKINY
jgi:hypothetical protein